MSEILKGGTVSKSLNKITENELKLINSYTRRNYSENELYVFNVVLCDNDIDRDNEAFSNDALYDMSKLFVGKTGIIDHKPSAVNQTARIYSCFVEKVGGRKTAFGDDYYRLVAKAYIPIIKDTEKIISLIDGGILKEVSVGCFADKITCSICGADTRTHKCNHLKGQCYESVCYHILDNISDAYEWSFVAVPSQRNAGVVKNYNFDDYTKGENILDIITEIKKHNYKSVNESNINKVAEYITDLEKYAKYGKRYRDNLEKDYLKYSALCFENSDGCILKNVAEKLTLEELESMTELYKRHIENKNACTPQLLKSNEENEDYYNI